MIVKLIFLFFLCALIVAVHAQKTVDGVKRGMVNGAATYLPKPDYPQEAKDFCASGKVEIEVLIGENGNVIRAKAISGDELLRDVSVKAVKKAKFSWMINSKPVKKRGIIVYNFPSEKKCIDAGIVNKKATFIPKPEFPKSCRCAGNVVVQIIYDQNGKVTKARAVSGNPLLRISAVKSAQKAWFSPPLVETDYQFYVKGLLVYNFSSDGKISF